MHQWPPNNRRSGRQPFYVGLGATRGTFRTHSFDTSCAHLAASIKVSSDWAGTLLGTSHSLVGKRKLSRFEGHVPAGDGVSGRWAAYGVRAFSIIGPPRGAARRVAGTTRGRLESHDPQGRGGVGTQLWEVAEARGVAVGSRRSGCADEVMPSLTRPEVRAVSPNGVLCDPGGPSARAGMVLVATEVALPAEAFQARSTAP